MEYKIEGLTKKQVAILDIMWAMVDLEQVERFIESLPLHDRTEAQSLMTLVAHEAIEELVDAMGALGYPDAQAVIEKVKSL